MVCVVCQILLYGLLHWERIRVQIQFSFCPLEYLFPIHGQCFSGDDTLVVFGIVIFYPLSVKDKSVLKLNLQVRITGIGKVGIIIRLFPFLGEVVNNVKYSEAEIGLTGTIGAIYDTVLDDIILNSVQIEIIIAVPGEVQLNLIRESTEIFYGKLSKHSA